jgi:hypothetical protein
MLEHPPDSAETEFFKVDTPKNAKTYPVSTGKSSAGVAQLSFGLVITDPVKARQQAARKERKCLSCSRMFLSHGAGNRICQSCKKLVSYSGPSDCSVSINTAF